MHTFKEKFKTLTKPARVLFIISILLWIFFAYLAYSNFSNLHETTTCNGTTSTYTLPVDNLSQRIIPITLMVLVTGLIAAGYFNVKWQTLFFAIAVLAIIVSSGYVLWVAAKEVGSDGVRSFFSCEVNNWPV